MPLFDLPARLVLASTSRYREAQLARFGLAFACVAPDYVEGPVPGLDARARVRHHARQKALAVQALAQHRHSWILGADQGVVLDEPDGTILVGKPGSAEGAVHQLLSLAGREHELLTHVVLALPDGRLLERSASVTLAVRPLTELEARTYVELDQPLDCAGSYRIEAAGPSLFEWIHGDDPTAIEGLPMIGVAHLLRQGLGQP